MPDSAYIKCALMYIKACVWGKKQTMTDSWYPNAINNNY